MEKRSNVFKRFISSDATIQYLFDELSSIRKYTNDMHDSINKIDGRVSKIEGQISMFVRLGLPIITGLIVSMLILLAKIAFGV